LNHPQRQPELVSPLVTVVPGSIAQHALNHPRRHPELVSG
jgi:hypothetical protein